MIDYEQHVYIYAIKEKYRKNNRILYVGQTINPKKRKEQHWNPIKGKFKNRKDCKFVILEKCSEEIAHEKETSLIKHFKSLGQCEFNKKNGTKALRLGSAEIYVPELRKTFRSNSEVARFFKCVPSTLGKVSDKFRKYYDYTLIRVDEEDK